MQLGRIDEAIALFEQVLAVDPARGHAALINARRFPQDEETLIRLENLARRPGLLARCSLDCCCNWLPPGKNAKSTPEPSPWPTTPMPPAAHCYVTIRLHTGKAARVSVMRSAVRYTKTDAASATIQRCRYSCWVCRVPVPRWSNRSWQDTAKSTAQANWA
jgi:hypothetical protein